MGVDAAADDDGDDRGGNKMVVVMVVLMAVMVIVNHWKFVIIRSIIAIPLKLFCRCCL